MFTRKRLGSPYKHIARGDILYSSARPRVSRVFRTTDLNTGSSGRTRVSSYGFVRTFLSPVSSVARSRMIGGGSRRSRRSRRSLAHRLSSW